MSVCCIPWLAEGRKQTASAPGGAWLIHGTTSWGFLSSWLLAEPGHFSLTKSSPEVTNPKLQHGIGIPDTRTGALRGWGAEMQGYVFRNASLYFKSTGCWEWGFMLEQMSYLSKMVTLQDVSLTVRESMFFPLASMLVACIIILLSQVWRTCLMVSKIKHQM